MQLLAVPNWSFGREKGLVRQFKEILSHDLVTLHYCEADVDQNRTVTAFSGDADVVVDMVMRLAFACFDTIDLNKHVGTHPRIGALDVCPLVLTTAEGLSKQALLMNALAAAEDLAGMLAATFDLPIFLYEKSERGRHEADLPSLRKGGFGSLVGKELRPDFGPSRVHPRLGVTVLGVRDFLITFTVSLETEDVAIAETIARHARQLRSDGDPRFLGVRVLALPLPTRKQVQLCFSMTLPNLTAADPIIEWVRESAEAVDLKCDREDLVGVIRQSDLHNSTRLPIKPSQIVDTDLAI